MTESILIVEDEEDIARLVTVRLELEGFKCSHVARGDDAFDAALLDRPDLVLLDLMLPGLDGIEVCRLLRKDPRTSSTGIIVLTARDLPADRVAGLDAGADDYINKPFDMDELVARIQTSLRRARQLRATSPLTGLPGNFEIEARLDARIADGVEFALLHVDIDRFKGYNDHYGFLRGDRAIVTTSRVILNAIDGLGGSHCFVGHVGGDDFVVVCEPQRADAIAERIVDRFDLSIPALYDDDDRERGYIERVDRTGNVHRDPLMTVSIGIASTGVRSFASSAEAAAVAVEMKAQAKATPGSAWRADRRRT